MKLNINNEIKKYAVEVICLLYILLFIYAAVSKFLDFENFQVQIGQSPLLSVYASWLSWMVPVMELITASALLVPKFRFVALYASLSLMVMFSAYIFIMLNYSDFVPCSCGGILEKMSWNVHLIFNVIFVFLAILAILLSENKISKYEGNLNTLRSLKGILGVNIFSTLIIIILFISSERIMHKNNPFLRRYPQHPILFSKNIDLKFNSYYFAGTAENKLYLGNYTDPLHIIEMDSNLENQKVFKISFDQKNIPFTMVTIKIRGKYFYLIDGTVPKIFRGRIKDWKVTEEIEGMPFFTLAEPTDSTQFIVRTNNGRNSSNLIGLFDSKASPKVKYNSKLLQQQIDGVFDTDGILLFAVDLKKVVYIYYYRNEIVSADQNLNMLQKSHTIDSISKARVRVAYLKHYSERTMSAPPLMVNAHAGVSGNLLFIHSKIKGQLEDNKLWDEAFIIDVYDLHKQIYLFSFPIYSIEDKKLQSFLVTKTHLYAIIGNQLAGYELRNILKKQINSLENKSDR